VIIYNRHGRTFGNISFRLGKMSTSIPFRIRGALFKLCVLLLNTFDLSITIFQRTLLFQFVPTDIFIFRFLLIRMPEALNRLRPPTTLALDGTHIIRITKSYSETFLHLHKDNFNCSLSQSWVREYKLTIFIKSGITFSVDNYRPKLFVIIFTNYINLIYSLCLTQFKV
jgi:hypothetical protein